MENKFCPCCGRHCPLSNPSCERGIAYAKSGDTDMNTQNGEAVAHYHKRNHGDTHRHNHERRH